MAAIPSFFSVGPQPFDQLGQAVGFALVIASAIPGPGRLSPTNFVSVPPQIVDTGWASGSAQINKAVVAGPGAVVVNRVTFGRHANALYNAEAIKTQIWPSVKAPSLSGFLGSWVGASPLQVDLNLPSFYDGPQAGGALPVVMTVVMSAPQQVDTTQQPFYDAPIVGATPGGLVPADAWTYGSHAVATYNAEAVKSQVWKSGVSRTTGSLGSWVSSAPQGVDFTQQTDFSAPLTVGAVSPVSLFFRSAPQQVDLTQQAFYDTPQPAGAVSRAAPFFTAAPQQVDLTQQSFFNAPVSVGPGPFIAAQWVYGSHAVATHNAEALKTRVWPSAIASTVAVSGTLGAWVSSYPQYVDPLQSWYDTPVTVQGWVLTFISATPDPTEYPTIYGFSTRPAGPGVIGSVIGSFVVTRPQNDLTQQSFFDTPQPGGSTPRVIPIGVVGEQTYVNPPPSITHSVVAIGGPVLGTVIAVGQQGYVDVQPRYYPSSVAGSVPRVGTFFSVGPIDSSQLAPIYITPLVALSTTGPVLPWVYSAPQKLDITQQPFFDAPRPGPLKGPVPPLVVAAPQYMDLTLQASFSKPLIIGQGRLGTVVGVPPQQFDYTLPSYMFQPLSARITYVVRAPERVELGGYGQRIVLEAYGSGKS